MTFGVIHADNDNNCRIMSCVLASSNDSAQERNDSVERGALLIPCWHIYSAVLTCHRAVHLYDATVTKLLAC